MPALHYDLPVDDDGVHVAPGAGVDDVIEQRIRRRGVQPAHIEHDQVRQVAGNQRAEPVAHADSGGGIHGDHFQDFGGGQRFGIARELLLRCARDAQLAHQIHLVVAGDAIRADEHAHTALQ